MKPSYLSHPGLLSLVLCAATCFAGGCQYLHTSPRQDMEYLPLKEYKYTPAVVDSGTAMRVIAYSGGKTSDKDHIYYCQFIAINVSTGDTVRVLSSLIGYDDPDHNVDYSYTTADMYDGKKGITDATFIPPDSNQVIALNVPEDVDNLKNGTDKYKDLSKITRSELVVINKSLPMLQTPSYKSIIGVLHFKGMPW